MMTPKTRGFSAIEILLVIVIIAVIGFVGYTVAQNTIFKKDTITEINMSEKATDVPEAPEIKVDSDLSEVTETLDNINLDDDSGDISTIESQLSEF